MSRAGTLIVFEGVEGAGKTTQIVRLAARLAAAGVPHASFREPGGTPVGDAIRALLLDPGYEITRRTEVLLFLASRAELVERELKPALAGGLVVLLDRFSLSTYAYQIAGRGLAEREVRAANVTATAGVVPDLTLLLRVPQVIGEDRARRRGAADRMEASGAEFHARVAAAFARYEDAAWQASHPECGPILPVNGEGNADEVEERVLMALSERVPALRDALTAKAR